MIHHDNILDIDATPPHVDDPSVPNVARAYDYLLGGSCNTAVDREHARMTEELMPGAGECARTNRAFATRATRVAVEMGITQFLDLGAGIPTAGGLHHVALDCDPTVRWVAIDNELVAVEHGSLVTEGDDRVQYVYADLTKPHRVLRHPVVLEMLDFSRPVAILLCAALHLVNDAADPAGLVAAYRDATVRGSALILTHGTKDDPNVARGMAKLPGHYEQANNQYTPRSRDEVLRFAAGYDLLPPGCVLTSRWRPETLHAVDQEPKAGAYGFMGVR